ncbi:MAG TPA: hypothetical protein VEC37_01250 [Bacillota bacterium]|nr:hypothetical protein [Bacillota bacterium]
MQMNRMIRGIITGTVIGAAVGAVMLMRNKRMNRSMMQFSPAKLAQKTRETVPMVRDNAMRWTSAVRTGTRALTRKLSRRG